MADLLKEIKGFQGRFSDRIAGLVSRLETSGGRIIPNRRNLARIAEIVGEMKSSFRDPAFVQAVGDYVRGFDAITDDVLEKFARLGAVDPTFARGIASQFSTIASSSIGDPESFNASLFNPMAEDLLLAVSTGSPLEDTITLLSERSRELSEIVRQTAEGSSTILRRTITTYVADEVGAEFFYFQGRPIATTRDWCRAREGKYWHREEIEQWGRDAAAGDGWEGMVEGTNEKTIFVHLGGWYGKRGSCRHTLVPVDISDVPAEDLARMRAKGLVE